jgi:hypothetical protein
MFRSTEATMPLSPDALFPAARTKLSLGASPSAESMSQNGRGPSWVLRELLARHRTLSLFGIALLVAMVPTAIALGLDDRTLRGASVWLKPLKFMLSIGVLSLTTAWFVGHLPQPHRRGRWVAAVATMVIGAGSFELAYITLQAARGLGSHYNVDGIFHAVMYPLMGLGAIVLTASQPLLAWLLWRHPDSRIPGVYRVSVLAGLTLTFVLGGGVGALLSGQQPPAVAGMPLLGWSPSGGDLRPAHFLGIHSEHLLPAAGLLLATFAPSRGRLGLAALSLLHVATFGALVAVAVAARSPA